MLDLRDGHAKEDFNGTARAGGIGFSFKTDHPELLVQFETEDITLTGTNKFASFRGQLFGSIQAQETGFTALDVKESTIARAATAGIEVDPNEIEEWVDEIEAIGEGTVRFPKNELFGERQLEDPPWIAQLVLLAQGPSNYTIIFSISEP